MNIVLRDDRSTDSQGNALNLTVIRYSRNVYGFIFTRHIKGKGLENYDHTIKNPSRDEVAEMCVNFNIPGKNSAKIVETVEETADTKVLDLNAIF